MKKNKVRRFLAVLLAAEVVLTGAESGALRTDAAGKQAVVKLNKNEVSLKKGKKVTLKIVTKNVKKIVSQTWKSKNSKIASVNGSGTVTGKKAGKSTVITCKVRYQVKGTKTLGQKKLSCKVNVKAETASLTFSSALVPHIHKENRIQQNPYLSEEEAMIHNDIYSTDVTEKAMPLGIHPEIVESRVTNSPIATPAFFYDNYGDAVGPYSQILENGSVLSGGIAIRDMDSSDLKVLGKFQPVFDDNGSKYGIQISYSFVDKENYLVGPTTHGHIVMIKTHDDQGNILPVFEKKLDVDILSGAVGAFGEEIDKNLLSITYDYEGNIWFVTGGFHKNPSHSKAGFVGYLERACIDRILAGENVSDLTPYIHYQKLADGENAENGIVSHPEGCVILTNQACYLFTADASGVQEKWNSPYESSGGKAAQPEKGITGAGLAWGGGSTPTLTDELVLFTDNQDVINLIALDIKTGKTLVKTPVLDLGSDVIVSVENSICVYSPEEAQTSVLVCNWYGAGNAGLFEVGADSSVQSYDNVYDKNWLENGSSSLMPGIERVDLLRQPDGSYQSKKIWLREDLKDTSMIKFSTSAGYYYGYTQDEKTSEWGFIVLDYDTGETVLWQPVSTQKDYNNAAVGIMQGTNGNSVYCPTNSKVLVRFQDRFAYLPDQPEQKLDLKTMERHVMTREAFQKASESSKMPASYLLSATIADSTAGAQTLAFRVNGLEANAGAYTVYYMDKDGKLHEFPEAVITDSKGQKIGDAYQMSAEQVYEVRVPAEDAGQMDQDEKTGSLKVTVILAESK